MWHEKMTFPTNSKVLLNLKKQMNKQKKKSKL